MPYKQFQAIIMRWFLGIVNYQRNFKLKIKIDTTSLINFKKKDEMEIEEFNSVFGFHLRWIFFLSKKILMILKCPQLA